MWFTPVGKQAPQFCAVELVRLICWVTDCAGGLWAFPEGKHWKHFLRGKHFHSVESIWQDESTTCDFGGLAIPQEKGKWRGQGNTFRLPREIQSLFLSPKGLRETRSYLSSLGDRTLTTNPRMQFLTLCMHESNNGTASHVLPSLLPLQTERLRLWEMTQHIKGTGTERDTFETWIQTCPMLKPVSFITRDNTLLFAYFNSSL